MFVMAATSRQLALFASAAAPTRLVGDRGDVTYVPEFLDRDLADAVVRELRADTRWRADSRVMYGKRVLVPRQTAGRGEKMPQPWTPAPHGDELRLLLPQPLPRRQRRGRLAR
jgi:hypothetical protein